MGPNAKGALFAIVGFAIFSTHDVVVKYLGEIYSPFQIVFFSVLFGFPLVSLMLISDPSASNLRPKFPWWNVARTLSVLGASVTIFYAFSTIPLAQTYAMLFTVPLIVTLLSIPILGERVNIHRGGAIVLGMAGVLIVLRPGTAELGMGHLMAMIGACLSALASVIVRKIGPQERNAVLLLLPMLASFMAMSLLMPGVYKPVEIVDLGAMGIMALLYFVATLFMIGAYRVGEAAIVAPMQYSQMIWALIFGYFLFGEVPDVQTLFGVMVIIASGIYIVYREARSNNSKNTPVLRSRSRMAAGTYLRIGAFLPKSKRGGLK